MAYSGIPKDSAGRVVVDTPRTAFGESATAEKTPQVQVKFPYGVNPNIAQILTNHVSSSVTTAMGVASVTCAGVAESFSQIRSLDVIRYGPGQGAEFEGTCAFSTGVANSSQVFGPGDDDEGFYFGYNGTAFGVLHRYGGQLEVRTIEITAAATGTGNITITLDGTAVTVGVTSGDSISKICALIVAEADAFGNAGRGWEVHTDDNVSVEFISLVAENATGTFSFVDTDTTGVTAGTFNQATTTILGVSPTETWIAQTAWNVDVMDGTGGSTNPSGVELAAGNGGGPGELDINNMNVFRIEYQYLGAGIIKFEIENPDTGHFVVVHEIRYAGTAQIATLANPTMNLNIIAKTEAGYSGGALTMKTASLAGFSQGKDTAHKLRYSASHSKTTTGTTPLNILTIHSDIEFGGVRNKIFSHLDHISVASEASKTVTIVAILNPTEVGGTPVLNPINGGELTPMEYDEDGTTIVGGQELLPITLSGAESKDLDIEHLGIELRPGDRIVFSAILSSGADATVKVTASWHDLH